MKLAYLNNLAKQLTAKLPHSRRLPIVAAVLLAAVWIAASYDVLPRTARPDFRFLLWATCSSLAIGVIAFPLWQNRQLRQNMPAAKAAQGEAATGIGEHLDTNAETRNNRALLQSLIDYLPVLIFAHSLRPERFGRIVVWNKAAEIITGYRADSVIGKTGREAFPAQLARHLRRTGTQDAVQSDGAQLPATAAAVR